MFLSIIFYYLAKILVNALSDILEISYIFKKFLLNREFNKKI
jgi:hypothetical protein